MRDPQAVGEVVGLPYEVRAAPQAYHTTQNLHPGQYAPIIYRAQASDKNSSSGSSKTSKNKSHSSSSDGLTVGFANWGLVPAWTKSTDKADSWKMFNARSETVASKSTFSRLLPHKRCVVAFAGFYEWKLDARKQKQPYFVHYADCRPMLMAALYDVAPRSDVTGEGTNELTTFTVLTTDSSERLKWLHNRMPALITPEVAQQWLDTAVDGKMVLRKIVPYNGEDLVWHPVSKVGVLPVASHNIVVAAVASSSWTLVVGLSCR